MPDSLMTCVGIDAHLEERVDDALGDRVVAAAGAERRLAAAIGLQLEADAIVFLAGAGRRRCGSTWLLTWPAMPAASRS